MTQRAGHVDYDAMLKISSIPSDEPKFLVRAQDDSSGDTVRAWVELAAARGVPAPVLEQALRQADRMDRWPTKKTPDADHIAPGEAKRLAHAFSRRAWGAHLSDAGVPIAPTLSIALAERRGHDAAAGRIRELVRALSEALPALEVQIAATARGGAMQSAERHAQLTRIRDDLVAPALAKAEGLD